MKWFDAADGTPIAYQEWEPAGSPATLVAPPVVLHHGFIANANVNWVRPGVVEALIRAGRRVVALDARGHGASGKPHDSSFYGEEKMVGDFRRLFDLIGEERLDLAGYSMGAVVALMTASEDARVRRLVIGGVGGALVSPGGFRNGPAGREAIASALEAPDPATIASPIAVRFRSFADLVGGDREALAASARASSMVVRAIALGHITAPTLVIAGIDDPIAVHPEELVQAIPQAELKVVPGDHLLAVSQPEFAPAIVEFLGRGL
jgi:pimeloyl-ACP methyl ester carboxylesterase